MWGLITEGKVSAQVLRGDKQVRLRKVMNIETRGKEEMNEK